MPIDPTNKVRSAIDAHSPAAPKPENSARSAAPEVPRDAFGEAPDLSVVLLPRGPLGKPEPSYDLNEYINQPPAGHEDDLSFRSGKAATSVELLLPRGPLSENRPYDFNEYLENRFPLGPENKPSRETVLAGPELPKELLKSPESSESVTKHFAVAPDGSISLSEKGKRSLRSELYKALQKEIASGSYNLSELTNLNKHVDTIHTKRNMFQRLADVLGLSERGSQYKTLKSTIAQKSTEITGGYKKGVGEQVAILKENPLRNAEGFHVAMAKLNATLGGDMHDEVAKSLTIDSRDLQSQLSRLIAPDSRYTQAVEVPVDTLGQQFDINKFRSNIAHDASQLGADSARLQAWVNRIPNYQSVARAFDGMNLSSYKIGDRTADVAVEKILLELRKKGAIPSTLKVPLMCEALFQMVKKESPTSSDNEIEAAVGQMMSLAAPDFNPITYPNSSSAALMFLPNAAERKFSFGDEPANNQPIPRSSFSIKKSADGKLMGEVTYAFRHHTKSFEDGEKTVFDFNSTLAKDLLDPEAPWKGTLSGEPTAQIEKRNATVSSFESALGSGVTLPSQVRSFLDTALAKHPNLVDPLRALTENKNPAKSGDLAFEFIGALGAEMGKKPSLSGEDSTSFNGLLQRLNDSTSNLRNAQFHTDSVSSLVYSRSEAEPSSLTARSYRDLDGFQEALSGKELKNSPELQDQVLSRRLNSQIAAATEFAKKSGLGNDVTWFPGGGRSAGFLTTHAGWLPEAVPSATSDSSLKATRTLGLTLGDRTRVGTVPLDLSGLGKLSLPQAREAMDYVANAAQQADNGRTIGPPSVERSLLSEEQRALLHKQAQTFASRSDDLIRAMHSELIGKGEAANVAQKQRKIDPKSTN